MKEESGRFAGNLRKFVKTFDLTRSAGDQFVKHALGSAALGMRKRANRSISGGEILPGDARCNGGARGERASDDAIVRTHRIQPVAQVHKMATIKTRIAEIDRQ